MSLLLLSHSGGAVRVEPIGPPEFRLRALLEFGDKTNEGVLVKAVAVPWFEILEILRADPTAAYDIDPRKWEEIIAGAYERAGFDEVILTPRSGDFGKDVIAIKKGIGSIKIVDQVKAYSPGTIVTAGEVRELAGVIGIDTSVSKGVLTTTSTFAPDLLKDRDLAKMIPHRLELKPREILLPWLDSLRSQ